MVGQDDGEFVATESVCESLSLGTGGRDLRYCNERFVPGRMSAMVVVYALELVDIERCYG
jgi:hypothetical protein